MSRQTSLQSADEFWRDHADLINALHAEAKCARWQLPKQSFAEALRRSAAKHFAGAPPGALDLEAYLKSLHLEDLALACACNAGIEAAWEFFIAHFRQDLRRAASAISRTFGVGDDIRAEEVADSLYAELYGVRSGSPVRRKSLFEYFHGRSKLSTWLRAVLAQKQVDVLRGGGRTISLDAEAEHKEPLATSRAAGPGTADPNRDRYLRRVEQALLEALKNLPPRERMILACYYVDRLTLAEIGRMLGEHESTISRQLERTRRSLREAVTRLLQNAVPASNGRPAEPALDPAQIELAFDYAVEDWPFDLSRALSAADSAADPHEE